MIIDLGLKFHHYGLAVRSEKEALIFLSGIGYNIGKQVYDPEQDVHLRMCTSHTNPSVELVSIGLATGPLEPILKRSREMIYHTCYEVSNLEDTLSALEDLQLRIIPVSKPKPAILFGGRKVSFYQVIGVGLIELLES